MKNPFSKLIYTKTILLLLAGLILAAANQTHAYPIVPKSYDNIGGKVGVKEVYALLRAPGPEDFTLNYYPGAVMSPDSAQRFEKLLAKSFRQLFLEPGEWDVRPLHFANVVMDFRIQDVYGANEIFLSHRDREVPLIHLDFGRIPVQVRLVYKDRVSNPVELVFSGRATGNMQFTEVRLISIAGKAAGSIRQNGEILLQASRNCEATMNPEK